MKAIIIEDELPVRAALKKMLQLINSEITIIEECESVSTAVTALQTLQPDIVFMDIELKDGISFEILKAIPTISFQIIFITAFNHYAIKAFKFSAIDYLLKPIDPEELKAAIDKVKLQLHKDLAYNKALESLQQNLNSPKQLVVKTTENQYVIPIENLIRLEADGAYTHIIHTGERVLCSKNLKYYENLLDEVYFFRSHQSHLVHLKKVVNFSKEHLIMENNESIPVASRRKKELKNRLSKLLS